MRDLVGWGVRALSGNGNLSCIMQFGDRAPACEVKP
jgi:hypothetical protein